MIFRTTSIVALAAALIAFGLLLAGKRILIWETRVNPGDSIHVEGYDDLGKGKDIFLVCRYFTGRSIATSVFAHSPNNMFGKDECPFLIDRG